MSLCIKAIGTAVPENWITQQDAAEAAAQFCGLTEKQRRLIPVLYRHAGVRKRHSVVLASAQHGRGADQTFYRSVDEGDALGPSTAQRMRMYADCAAPLAARAARCALRSAQVHPAEITHLVTVSCSGFSAPGVDVRLIRELGLPAGIARTHVGFMGCHAALNALKLASAFVQADPAACVLVCAVELCSLHHQYGWNPEQIVANALFADGAAAAVCVRDTGEHESAGLVRGIGSASTVVPDSEDLMSWQIGDHGFEMGLSSRVPDVIRASLPAWIDQWLGEHNLAVDRVGEWAIHPGGPRILQACREALDLKADAIATSTSILGEYGNMSSPTILFIVERLAQRQAAGPWVLLAFGPGLTIEAALFEPQVRPAVHRTVVPIAASET